VHCRLDRGGLLAICVPVDIDSLTVVAETAGVVTLTELVTLDEELPEKNPASLDLPA
jgi:hypothetical protein